MTKKYNRVPPSQQSKYDYSKKEPAAKRASSPQEALFKTIEASVKDVKSKDLFMNNEITFAKMKEQVTEQARKANSERMVWFVPPMFTSFEQDAEIAAREKVKDYILKTEHVIRWDDVIGNDLAKQAMIEVIEAPTTHKDLYAFYGIKTLKGVLLYGPPGCGKTMLAKATSYAIRQVHKIKANDDRPLMLVINGTQIQSYWAGKTEETIRAIFAYARLFKKKFGYPLPIFIDEAEAILPRREGNIAQYMASNVSTFLTEMDGMEENAAFVILATNRPDSIDEALLRDGRCDRKIKVERPDEDGIRLILQKTLDSAPLDVNCQSALMAEQIAKSISSENKRILQLVTQNKGTEFLLLRHIVNGAMIEGIVNRAKSFAFQRDLKNKTRSGINVMDLEYAIQATVEENIPLMHSYALIEAAERIRDNFAVTPLSSNATMLDVQSSVH